MPPTWPAGTLQGNPSNVRLSSAINDGRLLLVMLLLLPVRTLAVRHLVFVQDVHAVACPEHVLRDQLVQVPAPIVLGALALAKTNRARCSICRKADTQQLPAHPALQQSDGAVLDA